LKDSSSTSAAAVVTIATMTRRMGGAFLVVRTRVRAC
jgi:hypothetical protein